jgi:hypothetical protein
MNDLSSVLMRPWKFNSNQCLITSLFLSLFVQKADHETVPRHSMPHPVFIENGLVPLQDTRQLPIIIETSFFFYG